MDAALDQLYAAMIAAPDEDAPRLALADEIERHGDAARAEFIRLQCAVPHDVDTAGGVGGARIAELLVQHGDRWLAGLSNVARTRDFSRGFLRSVEGLSADLVATADRLEREAPLEYMAVDGPYNDYANDNNPDFVPGFLELPVLDRIAHLHLAEPMNAIRLAEVLAAPRLAGLTRLSAYDPNGVPSAIDEIARHIRPSLKMFGIVGHIVTDFDDQCAAVLARTPGVSGLEHLRLWNCNLREDGAAAIASSQFLRALRTLDLGLGQYTLNRIGEAGCVALAQPDALPNLESLDLDFNEVGDLGWNAMVASGKLAGFTRLRLQRCRLTDESVVPMWSGPTPLDSLVTLDLSLNQIGPASAIALAAAAPHALRTLWIRGCPIGDEGVAALARAPWVAQLHELNLQQVGMTDEGAALLLHSPYVAAIPRLDCSLQDPRLSPSVVDSLKQRQGGGPRDPIAVRASG